MAKYDLTNSLETEFTFSIGGKDFNFRKPTVREMRGLSKHFSEIEKEEDQDKQVEMGDEAMNELYKFVTPIDHDEKIGEVINNQPVNVQVAFNEMIKTELGAS